MVIRAFLISHFLLLLNSTNPLLLWLALVSLGGSYLGIIVWWKKPQHRALFHSHHHKI